MKKAEQVTMSRAEFERSKQRWFLIAGRPIKIAAGLLDKAKAGTVKVYGGLNLTRDSTVTEIMDEEESVVVPGSHAGDPLPDGTSGPNLYCAVILKTVDEGTRSKTSINEFLRD